MSPVQEEAATARAGHRQPTVVSWLRLARVYQKVQQRTQRHLRQFGLTTAQFDVLAQVGSAEGLSQQELARRLLVTKGNVCGLVDRMADAGLVVRRADPDDRRAHRLELTDQGRQLYAVAVPSQEALIAEIFGGLDRDEQRALQAMLRNVDHALDADA